MDDYIKRIRKYEQDGYLKRTTLNHELGCAAAKHPDKTALIDVERSVTYRELMSEIHSCAARLQKAGIRKGDNVLLQLPNRIEFIVTLFALCRLGAAPVLMLPSHREKELLAIGNLAEATAYISTSDCLGVDYSEMIQNVLPDIKSIRSVVIAGLAEDLTDERTGWYELCGERHGQETEDCAEPEGIALYLLSGGTTGIPKLIPRLHEAYACMVRLTMERCRFDETVVYLAVLSTSHDLGLANPGVLGALFAGGTAVLCETTSFDEAFDMIEEHQVTATSLVPAITRVWADALDWYEADFSSMKQIMLGAAKVDQNVVKKLMEKMGVKIQNAYGLGEGITCCTEMDEPEEIFMNTQGRPVSPADEMIIIDEAGNECPPEIEGELAERGPYTFGGYYKNPQLNQRCFIKDGFFRTGDKARITAEGNLVILGRTAEQINRGGENIIPSEIETFLMNHPEIKEASVLGIPDKALGERVAACIVTENSSLDRSQICRYLTECGVASYKFPDQIVIVEQFPYINIGKVDKNALRERIMEGSK